MERRLVLSEANSGVSRSLQRRHIVRLARADDIPRFFRARIVLHRQQRSSLQLIHVQRNELSSDIPLDVIRHVRHERPVLMVKRHPNIS